MRIIQCSSSVSSSGDCLQISSLSSLDSHWVCAHDNTKIPDLSHPGSAHDTIWIFSFFAVHISFMMLVSHFWYPFLNLGPCDWKLRFSYCRFSWFHQQQPLLPSLFIQNSNAIRSVLLYYVVNVQLSFLTLCMHIHILPIFLNTNIFMRQMKCSCDRWFQSWDIGCFVPSKQTNFIPS